MTPSLFAESIYCFLFTVRFIEFGRIIELWEKFFKGGLGTHTPTHTPSYATPFSFTHMQKEKDTKWTYHIWIGEASQRFVLERCCLKISKEFIESSVWQVSIILRHSLGLMVIVTQQALYATKTFCNFCSIWKRPLLIHLTYCEFLQLRTETNAHKLREIYQCFMLHVALSVFDLQRRHSWSSTAANAYCNMQLLFKSSHCSLNEKALT